MEQEKKSVVVPWDFTPRCDAALQHAVNFAKRFENDIVLVHIVAPKGNVSDFETRLKSLADEAAEKYKINVRSIIKTGVLYQTFKEFAKEIPISLFVMKTDGVRGFKQKYFSSNAMKLIFEIQIPFVVVQNPPKRTEYKSIVFPIDYSFESKEKLHWVKWISRYYKTQIQIITPDIGDGGLRQKIKNNVIFAKNILNDDHIDYEIIVGAGKGDFVKAIQNFSQKADVDMIMAMMPKDLGFTDYMSGGRTQKILANQFGIPVFVINPRPIRRVGGFGG